MSVSPVWRNACTTAPPDAGGTDRRHKTPPCPCIGFTSAMDRHNARLSAVCTTVAAPISASNRHRAAARQSTDCSGPSTRRKTIAVAGLASPNAAISAELSANIEVGAHAAPETSFSLPIAAVMACTAIFASSQGTITVRVFSGTGMAFNVRVCITPNVPNDPAINLDKSNPVTFFITRPPDLKSSPRPLTASNPKTWSRAAPDFNRRGPEMLVATSPPSVPSRPSPAKPMLSPPPNNSGKSPGSN